MRDDRSIYLESHSLFLQIRDRFVESADEPERDDFFQVDDLTFYYIGQNHQPAQASREIRRGFFIDEAYDAVVSKQGQYELILWMNWDNSPAPAAFPEPDMEVAYLEQLMTLGTFVPRPSAAQCIDWWLEWNLPDNIKRHVTKVAAIAYKLALEIRRAGLDVDPILTHRAGLVHDLDKIETLHQANRHGHVSADFMIRRGYPELAEIVRHHLLGLFLVHDLSGFSWEMKLVNYCDKLVEGDRVVLLPERLSALKQRYPQSRSLIDSAEPHLWRLDNEICSILDLDNHESLVNRLID